jgi:hypothetical protein
MNSTKWRNWRLDVLNGVDEKKTEGSPEPIEEAFHYLTAEEKMGLAIREMKKSLTLIERQFLKANESNKIDEAQVDNWVKTYKSLQFIEKKVKSLLKTMKGEM